MVDVFDDEAVAAEAVATAPGVTPGAEAPPPPVQASPGPAVAAPGPDQERDRRAATAFGRGIERLARVFGQSIEREDRDAAEEALRLGLEGAHRAGHADLAFLLRVLGVALPLVVVIGAGVIAAQKVAHD